MEKNISHASPHDASSDWSACAATYSFSAEISKNNDASAGATVEENMSRGAKIAAMMVFVMDYISGDEFDRDDAAGLIKSVKTGQFVAESNYQVKMETLAAFLGNDFVLDFVC